MRTVKSEKTHLWRPICLPLNYGTQRSEKRNAKWDVTKLVGGREAAMRGPKAGRRSQGCNRRSRGCENVDAFTFDSRRGCFDLCFFFD